MRTLTDRDAFLPGYFPSRWPVECGGNRRQKAAHGGLNARGATAIATPQINGRWNVMMIRRGEGELFLGGTMPPLRARHPLAGYRSWIRNHSRSFPSRHRCHVASMSGVGQ